MKNLINFAIIIAIILITSLMGCTKGGEVVPVSTSTKVKKPVPVETPVSKPVAPIITRQ